jgi:hypothetical protein
LEGQVGSTVAPTNTNPNSLIYWLKIAGTISAGATQTVYMIFADRGTTVWDGTLTGIAPQWTATYGQYDNGASVFNFYTNFAGTSLPSGWASSSSVIVNNGLSFSQGAVYTTSAVFSSLNNIEEAYYKLTSSSIYQFCGLIQSNTIAPQSSNGGSNNEILWITGTSTSTTYYAYASNGTIASYNIQSKVGSSFTPSVNTFYIIGTYMIPTGVGEMANYNTYLTANGIMPNTNQYIILGFYSGSNSGTTSIIPEFVQWVRVRAYPPNGVMPAVQF